jgi:hypothetical protein
MSSSISEQFKKAYSLTPTQKKDYSKQGFLVVDLFSEVVVSAIQQWTKEVSQIPRTAESIHLDYDEILPNGDHVLCRTENFVNLHSNMSELLRRSRLMSLMDLAPTGQEMVLFKEKSKQKFKAKLQEAR